MGKKQLNVDAIRSELTEGSAFFRDYRKPVSSSTLTTQDHDLPENITRTTSTPVPPVRIVRDVPLVPPAKRVMKQRHPFDIYRDQYEALQQLALEERKQGGVGSMSAMVREAIDKLIAERKNRSK